MQRYMIDLIELVTLIIFPVIFFMTVIYRLFKAITTKTLIIISSVIFVAIYGIVYDWSKDDEIRVPVIVPNYRVDFVERPGPLEHVRYYEVVRGDGKKAQYYIDEDANKCEDFNTTHEGARVYFHCSGDYAPARISYVDVEKHELYAGYSRWLQKIDTLEFK